MSAPLRTAAGSPHARILGIGSYRPARVVPNDEICARIDSSDEWIRTRSGISTRRFAGPEESLTEMAVTAAGKAIAQAGITAEQVDFVLVATITHFKQTPSAAADIAHRLGTRGAAALDVSAACAGFCYGLALASDMVRCGSARHVVVIGAERMSEYIDPDDRATAFLFGDGAGAAVVGPSEMPGIGPVAWGSDGSSLDAIEQTQSWSDLRADPELSWPTIRMAGQRVFRWASYAMVPVARQALDAAGVTLEDLDAFIPHQANLRITEAMAKALRLPSHVRVARDIVEQGNTSGASVPLAMDRMLETGEARSGDTALLIGFGAGLAYAAQVVTLP
jgi:3-oxoacyl-[acyl-carrier-protein] synthase III